MKKILIVDDDEFIRSLMVKATESEGYKTDQGVNGQDAIKKLETNIYDLIVTDVVMPFKSGISVIDFIRENNITAPVLVVSAFSSHSGNKGVLEFSDYFADEILAKPFSKEEFLAAIHRVLDGAVNGYKSKNF